MSPYNVLHFAAITDCVDILQHLLNLCPSEFLQMIEANNNPTKDTPLHFAAEHNSIDTVRLLGKLAKEKGIKIDVKNKVLFTRKE